MGGPAGCCGRHAGRKGQTGQPSSKAGGPPAPLRIADGSHALLQLLGLTGRRGSSPPRPLHEDVRTISALPGVKSCTRFEKQLPHRSAPALGEGTALFVASVPRQAVSWLPPRTCCSGVFRRNDASWVVPGRIRAFSSSTSYYMIVPPVTQLRELPSGPSVAFPVHTL